MADIRDEHGNPVKLTDELGRPVQLTDEHGNPIHLTGVATTTDPYHGTATTTTMGSETHGGTHFAPTPTDYAKRGAEAVVGAGGAAVGAVAGAGKAATHAVTGGGAPASHGQTPTTTPHGAGYQGQKKELERSSSSSSSSSEDDGQGGRRKKKGLMAKIKDKLPGHKDKEEQDKEKEAAGAAHSFTTKISSSTQPGQPHHPDTIRVEHHEQEHKKGGLMEKIKEKLPGHHSST